MKAVRVGQRPHEPRWWKEEQRFLSGPSFMDDSDRTGVATFRAHSMVV